MKKKIRMATVSCLVAILLFSGVYALYRQRYSASTLILSESGEICDNEIDDNGDGIIDGCWDPGVSYSISGRTFNVKTTEELVEAGHQARAGDGILIDGGQDPKNPIRYTENLVMANAGLPEKPIIIKGVGIVRPVIEKQEVNTGRIEPKSNTIIEYIHTSGIQTINNDHGLGGYGVYVRMDQGIKNILIKNCLMVQHEKAIRFEEGERLIVRDSVFRDNEWATYIGTDNDDPKVHEGKAWEVKNTLWENVEADNSVFDDAHTDGFLVEGDTSHHVFRNCKSHGFHDGGFDIKGHVIIENSMSYDNRWPKGGDKNGYGFKLWRDAQVRNSIAYGNAISNYTFGGLQSGYSLVNSISSNGQISFEKRDASDQTLSPSTVFISHNIFYNTSINDEIGNVFSQSDHNMFYGEDIPDPKVRGTGAVVADPKFTDIRTSNYHLRDSSPAIDAGKTDLTDLMAKVDLDGKARKAGNAVDIGPYEYGSAVDDPNEDNGEDNEGPVFTSARIRSTAERQKLVFEVAATDKESSNVAISATALPEGAIFERNMFSWTPSEHGGYRASFEATDGSGIKTTQTVYIRVTHPVNLIEKRTVNLSGEGRTITFQVCRNPLYTNKYDEVFLFGDQTEKLRINETGRSRCSNFYQHTYAKNKEYQLTLYLCQMDRKGTQIGCIPNVVKNLKFGQ